jgi:Protein of unknown function (DUF2442)
LSRWIEAKMSYLPEINKAKLVNGFIIALRFNDGTQKHVDISQWFKGPVFRPLKDPEFFAKFFVEGGTLAWPNGVDIAPESLYDAADVRSAIKTDNSATRKNSPKSK